MVCSDLIARGFDVYRAVSQSSDCDLVAVRNDKILRIEVKTAYENLNGSMTCPPPKDENLYDVLAKVGKASGIIEYEPWWLIKPWAPEPDLDYGAVSHQEPISSGDEESP